MKHTADVYVEKKDRLSPILIPLGDNEHTAMLCVGDVGNDVNVKFRDHEALIKFIAVLVTLDREWHALDTAAESFAAEPAN